MSCQRGHSKPYRLLLLIRHDFQGAFHVVNPEDLRREIELLLGVAAYSLLPWRGGATLFWFIRRNCVGMTALFTINTNDFTLVSYCQSHIKNTKLYT